MNRIRIAVVAAVGVALFATVLVAGSTHWTHSKKASTPARYMPVPGGDVGEDLGRGDSYWSKRVTYPTGNFSPAWVRERGRRGQPHDSAASRPAGSSRSPRAGARPPPPRRRRSRPTASPRSARSRSA